MHRSQGEFLAGDLRLAYREQGRGPLLLVLPGNTASSALHEGELAYFGDRFRTVSPDFRGTGRSDRIAHWPDDWYQRCADDMALLVQHLGESRCLVMGTSGGAIVALWLAIRHPAIVRAVVADSTASGYPPQWLHAAMDTRLARSPGQIHFWRGAHGDDWEQVIDEDTAMLRRIADRGGSFFDGRLAEIRCPVLITAGLGDTVLPDAGRTELDLLEQIRDGRLFLAREGDHPLMWSNALEFRRVAGPFLDDASRS